MENKLRIQRNFVSVEGVSRLFDDIRELTVPHPQDAIDKGLLSIHGHGGTTYDFPETEDKISAFRDIIYDDERAHGQISGILRLQLVKESVRDHVKSIVNRTIDNSVIENGGTIHLYLSKPESSALANHTDVTDIFVLQLSGAKEWILCDADAPQFAHKLDRNLRGKLDLCTTYNAAEMDSLRCERTILYPGDALYLPKHVVHSAQATPDGLSAHLTFGFAENTCSADRMDSCLGVQSRFQHRDLQTTCNSDQGGSVCNTSCNCACTGSCDGQPCFSNCNGGCTGSCDNFFSSCDSGCISNCNGGCLGGSCDSNCNSCCNGGCLVCPTPQPTRPPTPQPTPQPTPGPTHQPTPGPTAPPTPGPTPIPTPQPTPGPSPKPSDSPTDNPSYKPSQNPSREPSSEPSGLPSQKPSREGSLGPTFTPSTRPTGIPSISPSLVPSTAPSEVPSVVPSESPSDAPSAEPSRQPSLGPTIEPSVDPTFAPVIGPTPPPTPGPTSAPTIAGSAEPSTIPSAAPTGIPSVQPSRSPSITPFVGQTPRPTVVDSSSPSLPPTESPTLKPVVGDTARPSLEFSNEPSAEPSMALDSGPSAVLSSSMPSSEPSFETFDREEDQNSISSGTGLDSSVIFGIVGAAAVLFGLCFLYMFFFRKKKKKVLKVTVDVKPQEDGTIKVKKKTEYRGNHAPTIERLEFPNEVNANANGYFIESDDRQFGTGAVATTNFRAQPREQAPSRKEAEFHFGPEGDEIPMAAAIVGDDDGQVPIAEIGLGSVGSGGKGEGEEDDILSGMKKRKDTKGGTVVGHMPVKDTKESARRERAQGGKQSDEQIKTSARQERDTIRESDRQAKRAARSKTVAITPGAFSSSDEHKSESKSHKSRRPSNDGDLASNDSSHHGDDLASRKAKDYDNKERVVREYVIREGEDKEDRASRKAREHDEATAARKSRARSKDGNEKSGERHRRATTPTRGPGAQSVGGESAKSSVLREDRAARKARDHDDATPARKARARSNDSIDKSGERRRRATTPTRSPRAQSVDGETPKSPNEANLRSPQSEDGKSPNRRSRRSPTRDTGKGKTDPRSPQSEDGLSMSERVKSPRSERVKSPKSDRGKLSKSDHGSSSKSRRRKMSPHRSSTPSSSHRPDVGSSDHGSSSRRHQSNRLHHSSRRSSHRPNNDSTDRKTHQHKSHRHSTRRSERSPKSSKDAEQVIPVLQNVEEEMEE
ncbi:unnamed protein product [Cylindrotheca closterium]|uniref:Circumsporozoite protein n=1 Tax=Cylindrotheca closterium TaxID=2856 RepID=A0AAD2CLC4_9STRA|nr:unnamed protein product [Cylindrotheca closterium]